jgi:hypothetical protein
MKYILAAITMCSVIASFGQSKPVPLGTVKEGVYFTQNGYSTSIIELNDKQFRYWFDSDVQIKPRPHYPLSGNYSVKNGTISLPHKDIHEKEWTFMTFDGKATLWRPAALKYWDETKKIDPYGVLFPTNRKPEDIWERKQPDDAVPPGRYSLSVGRIYESDPERPEWVFIFGGTGAIRGGETVCSTPASLKRLLKGLPRGSTLDWWPTCRGEADALAGHLDDLKNVCTEAGIAFTLHPSG